jgi:hypothetical protein
MPSGIFSTPGCVEGEPEDRLAEPTLPANPSLADIGAQDYWLHCMPCHGDKGQGLTDEFRQLYPPEDQNCWNSGCHGARPYEDGWTLPSHVPALVGPGALSNFTNDSSLYGFIRATMPWHDPTSLEDESYQRITAFLVRQSGHIMASVGQDVPGDLDEYPDSSWLFAGLAFILVGIFLAGLAIRHFLRT